ncbi:MAG: ATP-binding protein [Fimbriimonadales bacterium]|nr:ATP-binding protein [Fimbriimonadales bacterium]
MSRLGLRERLLLFYALMALVPVLAAGALLYNYLNSQVSSSATQFQVGVRQELRNFQHSVREGVAAVLQESQQQVRQRLNHQLEAHRDKTLQRQNTLLRDTVRDLQIATRNALQQTERDTTQNLNQTLSRLEQQMQQAQVRSLATLQATTEQATRNALQELIVQHLTQISAQLSRQVEGLMRNYTAQLTLIAQQPAIQNAHTQESRWILQSLQDREPAYQALTLLDAQGNPLVEIGDSLDDPALTWSDRRLLWEKLTSAQETTVGEARLYRVEGRLQPLIPVMTPVRLMGKEFRGAIFALISLEEASALTRSFRLGERGDVALIQRDGLILAHPDLKRVGQKEMRFPESLYTVASAHSQLMHLPEGELLVAAAPIRSLRAVMVITQPSDEAFQLVAALQQSLQQSFQQQRAQTNEALRQTRAAAQTRFTQLANHQQQATRAQIKQAGQRAVARTTQTLTQLAQAQQRSLSAMLEESSRATQQQLEQGLSLRLNEVFLKANLRLAEIAGELRASINERVRESFVTVMLGVLAFLLVGAVFLHRTLVRPLRILVKATHDIAAGDLTRRVELPNRGCPDLDDLADSFNHMVDAVQKAEAQLIQSSKLASLGTLASGVAHELNQPLAIIRAIAQQNLDALAQSESLTPSQMEALKEDLQIVHRQTVRMSQIIQHLRAFSRKPREEFEPVNLNEVAQNALILLREQLRQRGITLIENYASDLPSVLGEANSLEQIVINLLTNARDALEGREDGQITIETGLHDDGKQVYAALRVRDNGPGVPPDIRQQIFDPFFTTKDPNKGTGLGLSISLEIAQKHGGRLTLGETEQGAEFVLCIPVAESRKLAA